MIFNIFTIVSAAFSFTGENKNKSKTEDEGSSDKGSLQNTTGNPEEEEN